MTRRLALLGAAALALALLLPVLAAASTLTTVALSLALAGPAAAAALAAAAGRPSLAMAACAGVGAYVSGVASLHGVPVPAAVVVGSAAATAAGALTGVIGLRMDPVAFLLATGLIAVALGAGVQALPAITGAQSGLGPLPQVSVPLGGGRTAVLTPLGSFHLMVLVVAVVTAAAMALERSGPGPRWRAIGSDRRRAAASGLRPLQGELTVLALAGLLSGVTGAVAAHLAGVATPGGFALDSAALPLLAALAAGRAPLGAVLAAVGTGLVGRLVLPDLGWSGPPPAPSVALGILAVATLAALLPRRRSRVAPSADGAVDLAASWPVGDLGLRGGVLTLPALRLRARDGTQLVDSPAITVAAGSIHAVVGANGAGKSTLLAFAATTTPTPPAGGGRGHVVLLPQEGGGFGNCTVAETLRLAAAGRGRPHTEADRLATAWLDRLGLGAAAGRNCRELSASRRRLVDLARVLLARPSVLLCDEPLAGLDDHDRAAVAACLAAAAAEGLTIIVAEHDRATVAALTPSVTELLRADLAGAGLLAALP